MTDHELEKLMREGWPRGEVTREFVKAYKIVNSFDVRQGWTQDQFDAVAEGMEKDGLQWAAIRWADGKGTVIAWSKNDEEPHELGLLLAYRRAVAEAAGRTSTTVLN